MILGDPYKHFKGGIYSFKGIALPLGKIYLSKETISLLVPQGTVRYHENTHDVELFSFDGVLFIDSDYPHVIYQAQKDQKVWAREVNDFFEHKNANGEYVRKFERI